jgi:hypothetical protein
MAARNPVAPTPRSHLDLDVEDKVDDLIGRVETLENTTIDVAVSSVNSQTGAVELDADAVGADPVGSAAAAAAGAAAALVTHSGTSTSVHGIADTAALLTDSHIGTTVQAHSAVLDATDVAFTTAKDTKLSGIEDGADVTDAANVAAAGAVMLTQQAIKVFYDDVLEEWPDPGVDDTVRVEWIQTVSGGSAPPAGGRPGREPGDLVWLRTA